MNKDDILVLRPLYKMKESEVLSARLDIRKQLSHGNVITIPFGWSVEVAPKDIEVKIAEKPEEESTPWEFIDNHNYSPFDSQGKERLIFCTNCGCNVEHYNTRYPYQYCPYCGKRHYFERDE